MIAFGNLSEIIGKETVADAKDTDALLTALKSQFPLLADRKILVAVNERVVKENLSLQSNDVVALMPPYSGG